MIAGQAALLSPGAHGVATLYIGVGWFHELQQAPRQGGRATDGGDVLLPGDEYEVEAFITPSSAPVELQVQKNLSLPPASRFQRRVPKSLAVMLLRAARGGLLLSIESANLPVSPKLHSFLLPLVAAQG